MNLSLSPPANSLTKAGLRKSVPLRMPAEHGAWGILLVPFLCAAAVAGAWNLPLLLCTLCVLSLFLLRGSVEVHRAGGARWSVAVAPVHVALAAVAGGTSAALVLAYGRRQLLLVGLAAAVLYLAQRVLAAGHTSARSEKRSLAAELVGVALLTLTAPAAWIAARGVLDGTAVELWLLCLLFFTGGVLYVKYRVRGILVHRKFDRLGERLEFAWPVLVYHLLLAAFLGIWLALNLQPGAGASSALRATLLGLAFAPTVLRAGALLFQLGRRFAIPRLGWTEIAHSAVFTALVIFAYRLAA